MIKTMMILNARLQNSRRSGVPAGIFRRLTRLATNHTFPEWYVRKFLGYGNTSKKDAPISVTISFDCDLKADVMALSSVIKTLGNFHVRASFACLGKMIEKYPKEHMFIIDHGHELINHTYTHPNHQELNPNLKFNELSLQDKTEEIIRCHETAESILRYCPMGFRTPHFGALHCRSVYRILEELNYLYSTSTIATRSENFGRPFWVGKVLEFPLSPVPADPFNCFETWSLCRAPHKRFRSEDHFFELFKKITEIAVSTGSYLNFYFDPSDVIKMSYLEKMIKHVVEHNSLRLTTYLEMVDELKQEN